MDGNGGSPSVLRWATYSCAPALVLCSCEPPSEASSVSARKLSRAYIQLWAHAWLLISSIYRSHV